MAQPKTGLAPDDRSRMHSYQRRKVVLGRVGGRGEHRLSRSKRLVGALLFSKPGREGSVAVAVATMNDECPKCQMALTSAQLGWLAAAG